MLLKELTKKTVVLVSAVYTKVQYLKGQSTPKNFEPVKFTVNDYTDKVS